MQDVSILSVFLFLFASLLAYRSRRAAADLRVATPPMIY